MSGFLWKATARNVNRALKEINAFEWEGDYRAEAKSRLKELLEEKMDEELERYLGRAKYERKREEGRRIIAMGLSSSPFDRDRRLILRIRRTRKGYVSKVLEAYKRRSVRGSADPGLFLLGMSTRKVSTLCYRFRGAGFGITVSEVARG